MIAGACQNASLGDVVIAIAAFAFLAFFLWMLVRG